MVDPSPPTPYGEPPYHDPWASTMPVPAAPDPSPAAPPGAGPQPPVPVSAVAYPPVASPGSAACPPIGGPGSAPITAPYPAAEPVIAQIGDIQVTSTTIRTPAGVFPLRGSQWTVTDTWTTEQKTPTWAIVMAIVGFFCMTVFSLLFLLAKETVHRAVVHVHVVSGLYQYVARIPATDQAQVQYVYQQVNYVRSLAAW